jgi:hypothetical protein
MIRWTITLTPTVKTEMSKPAGEHWTCAVLSFLGWGVALTRDGLGRTDVLAVQITGDRRMIEVQVKAARGVSGKVSRPLGPNSQLPYGVPPRMFCARDAPRHACDVTARVRCTARPRRRGRMEFAYELDHRPVSGGRKT